ncbi:MAG: hypothetical protein O2968_04400 [Acidobacteria bacterium]|nr:hypothetical protein [Acidobacteriota bacterium]
MQLNKRFAYLLMVVFAAVIHTGVAQAQFSHATCRAESPGSPVRAEGLAERTGNLTIACQPAVGFFFILPQQVIAELNLTLELNVALGNRVNIYGVNGLTDAVLTINQQNSYHPLADSQSDYSSWLGPIVGNNDPPLDVVSAPLTQPIIGVLSQCPGFLSPDGRVFGDARWPCPQLARLGGPNRLEWNGVKAPYPGVDAANAGFPFNVVPSFPEVTVFEIHNIRANAAELGVTDGGGGAFITARISIDPGFTFSMVNSVATIGTPFVGLIPTIEDAGVDLQCEDDSEHVIINLQEGFASAFKTLGAPTFDQAIEGAWENGYPMLEAEDIPTTDFMGGNPNTTFPFALPFAAPAQNTGAGGGATQATRFIFRLFNVQPGVTVKVESAINNDGAESGCEPDPNFAGELCLQLVTGTDPDGAGGSATGGSGTVEVAVGADGTGFFVYEVGDGSPFRRENIDVPVWFSWTFDGAADEPGIGTASVDVRFAPLSDVAGASNEPVPRFVDTGDDPAPVLTIQRCATTLLFPFVSNRAGFDTGISIANTSLDWKGTPPQRGPCMIHYIGNTGDDGPMPDDDISNVVEGGEVLSFTLSQGNPVRSINGAPNFQGFVAAMCEFQFAHGFAFINDGAGGLPAWSQGYLALVMQFDVDDDGEFARQIDCGDDCTSEGLRQ